MAPSLPPETPHSRSALVAGRLCIILAAVLWSTSGLFTKILTRDTFLGLNSPEVRPLTIACGRALFAASILLPTLRLRSLTGVRLGLPIILAPLCFAVMNATFVSALALGTAANATVLQYTAPMWMYLACVWWLGEPPDRRSLITVCISLVGLAVIVLGPLAVGQTWERDELLVVAIALISGFTYAGVLICLRVMRDVPANFLTALNLSVAGAALLPFVLSSSLPSGEQLLVLFCYGAGQLAIPYWLVARGLRTVSPQEAGALTLLEPLLTPLWSFLIAGEVPRPFEMVGGAIIIGALLWRYLPRRG